MPLEDFLSDLAQADLDLKPDLDAISFTEIKRRQFQAFVPAIPPELSKRIVIAYDAILAIEIAHKQTIQLIKSYGDAQDKTGGSLLLLDAVDNRFIHLRRAFARLLLQQNNARRSVKCGKKTIRKRVRKRDEPHPEIPISSVGEIPLDNKEWP